MVLEVNEGFFCYNMQNNPVVDFVSDMVAKRDLFKKQGKKLLQTLVEKNANSVDRKNFRRDIENKHRCVTENWRGRFMMIGLKKAGL